MRHWNRRLRWAIGLTLAGVFAGAVSLARPASDHWSNFARDAQHTARSQWATGAQPLNRVIWSTPVDLDPQFSDGELQIHYGSPLITAANTVIVPVKTGATGGFRVDARSAADGSLIWSLPRSEEHTSELQSLRHLVCRLLLEKKKHYSDRRLRHCASPREYPTSMRQPPT